MYRLVALVITLLASSIAQADAQRIEGPDADEADAPHLTVGVSGSLLFQRYLAYTTDLELGLRLSNRWFLDAVIGRGAPSLYEPGGSNQEETSVYAARAGVTRLRCTELSCLGVGGSLGFERDRLVFGPDDLIDRPMLIEVRQTLFVEARCSAALRLGPVAIEAALGGRFHLPVGGTEGGVGGGLVATAGLHLMI